MQSVKDAISRCKRVSDALPRLSRTKSQTRFFQSSHSLPPGYVTFCPVDLDAFQIPKESFYKCSHKYPVLQSTEPSCHKWEWKKGLAACGDTAIFHKLSPCSSKNLNHHVFFQVGFLPKFPPQNTHSKVRRASPWHKGVTRLGAKEDKDRPVMGSSSVIFSCHEITPEKDLLPGAERLQSGKGRGVLFVHLMTQLSRKETKCLTFLNIM